MSDVAVYEPIDAPPPAAAETDSVDRIGHVRVRTPNPTTIDVRLPGELGWGRALVGLVPIVWAAIAWALCWREGILGQRVQGCAALTAMASVSAALMLSSTGTLWRFDGRRKRISRRTGLLARSTNARRFAGLRVLSTSASAFADVQLKLVVVDATGRVALEIATWSRREIDRHQVDALAAMIRRGMAWDE